MQAASIFLAKLLRGDSLLFFFELLHVLLLLDPLLLNVLQPFTFNFSQFLLVLMLNLILSFLGVERVPSLHLLDQHFRLFVSETLDGSFFKLFASNVLLQLLFQDLHGLLNLIFKFEYLFLKLIIRLLWHESLPMCIDLGRHLRDHLSSWQVVLDCHVFIFVIKVDILVQVLLMMLLWQLIGLLLQIVLCLSGTVELLPHSFELFKHLIAVVYFDDAATWGPPACILKTVGIVPPCIHWRRGQTRGIAASDAWVDPLTDSLS